MDKQFILQEIKRTAAENGNKPLGRRRFEKETGIKESDWCGRHWARWGDAIEEAGYSPNQLTTALDEKFLIERFIELMRARSRFPTSAEIKMERRRDPAFPSKHIFSRFGSKAGLARRISEHCTGNADLADIAAMCEEVTATETVSNSNNDEFPSDQAFGVVYLMKSGRHYKIGRSNSAGRREYELAIQLPEKLTTIHQIQTDDPVGIEAYWHNRFKEKRKNGEWFDLDAADIKAFKRRKFM